MALGITFHQLEGVDPAIHEAVMGLAIVREIVDLDVIPAQR